MNTLEIKSVTKVFNKDFYALRDVSFTLKNGITGLVGPNGAGKTTLMDIISTISNPTEGEIYWNGVDILKNPDDLRIVLGYLPQETPIYPELNAEDFLYYIGTLKGIARDELDERIKNVLEIVHLYDVRKRKTGTYSGGMKRRIGIAQCLLNDPKLIIVDEPTVGLDPSERTNFKNLLARIATDKIVLLSSHIIPDIEAIASNIIFMKKGCITANLSDQEALNRISEFVWSFTCSSDELQSNLQKFIVSDSKLTDKGIKIRVISETKPDTHAIREIPTLEDAYYYFIQDKKNAHENA